MPAVRTDGDMLLVVLMRHQGDIVEAIAVELSNTSSCGSLTIQPVEIVDKKAIEQILLHDRACSVEVGKV